MGLQMTLPKDKNGMYFDFVNAYWKVIEISYTTDRICVEVACYPSRECSKAEGMILENPSFDYGGPVNNHVFSKLYSFAFIVEIKDIFPSGIPLDVNQQKTAIYNFVKSYTGLPFENVFEEG